MNIGEQLIPMGVSLFGGAVVGYAGKIVMDAWRRNREAVLGSDEYVLNKIETRFGMAFPKWVHDSLNAIVSAGVAAVDKIDARTVREVIRLIGSKRLDKGEELKTRFEAWAKGIDFGAAVLPLVPEEFREFVNEVKKLNASKTIAAQVKKELPEEVIKLIPPEKLSVMVDNAATANKINSPDRTTEELIKESQARQAKLRL